MASSVPDDDVCGLCLNLGYRWEMDKHQPRHTSPTATKMHDWYGTSHYAHIPSPPIENMFIFIKYLNYINQQSLPDKHLTFWNHPKVKYNIDIDAFILNWQKQYIVATHIMNRGWWKGQAIHFRRLFILGVNKYYVNSICCYATKLWLCQVIGADIDALLVVDSSVNQLDWTLIRSKVQSIKGTLLASST